MFQLAKTLSAELISSSDRSDISVRSHMGGCGRGRSGTLPQAPGPPFMIPAERVPVFIWVSGAKISEQRSGSNSSQKRKIMLIKR